MDVKIITNVGYWDGLNGKGAIYAGVTPGGTYLFAFQNLVGGTEKWTYLRKSQVQNGLSMGDMKVGENLNMTLFTDVESPEFATGSTTLKEIPSVTNGDDLPRLIQLEGAYTLKGEGVTTSDIDKLKTVSGSGSDLPATGGGTTNTGALGGLIPSDFSTLFSNPFKFAQDNPMFTFLVVVVVIYFVRKKKKKPLWIF